MCKNLKCNDIQQDSKLMKFKAPGLSFLAPQPEKGWLIALLGLLLQS